MPRYSKRRLEAAGMLVILALTATVPYVLLFTPATSPSGRRRTGGCSAPPA